MAQNSALSRDEIVSIISDFYTFLTTRTTEPCLPASALKTPPPSGWPQEHRDAFRKMGKSDEVVDLLSHLPYVDPPEHRWELFEDTQLINYTGELSQRRINGDYESKRYTFEPSGQKIPPHVFSLTSGSNYGQWLLVDVQAGKITQFCILGGPYLDDEKFKYEEDLAWRLYPTKPIREFFATCQEKAGNLDPAALHADLLSGSSIRAPVI